MDKQSKILFKGRQKSPDYKATLNVQHIIEIIMHVQKKNNVTDYLKETQQIERLRDNRREYTNREGHSK